MLELFQNNNKFFVSALIIRLQVSINVSRNLLKMETVPTPSVPISLHTDEILTFEHLLKGRNPHPSQEQTHTLLAVRSARWLLAGAVVPLCDSRAYGERETMPSRQVAIHREP